jgi:hypothetical protein
MRSVELSFLMQTTFDVPAPVDLGQTPHGHRRVTTIRGGTFEGPKLKGNVLGGMDWTLLRPDGVLQLDARLTLQTDDGQQIGMRYTGYRHGPKDVLDRLNRGEQVDPSLYYFRSIPSFETGSEKYSWLNKVCCVATATRSASGPTYFIYQVV